MLPMHTTLKTGVQSTEFPNGVDDKVQAIWFFCTIPELELEAAIISESPLQ